MRIFFYVNLTLALTLTVILSVLFFLNVRVEWNSKLLPGGIFMMIRPIIDNDVEAIAKIYTDNWKATYQGLVSDSFLESMTYEHSKEKWLSYIHTDQQGAFVAVDENDMIIGFAAYKPYDDLKDCLLLDSLHILQSVQGGGIGKKMIFTIGEYAYHKGYKKMSICIVKGNDRAEGIYTH